MALIPDPPAALLEGVGPPDQFRSCGLEFLSHFKNLADLADGENVLDIGCGPGRMAIPMAEWFPGLRYQGFDVSRPAVNWCRAEISKIRPSFNFTWVDLVNRRYNPTGSIPPESFSFPYEDEQFDLAILVSVFTHLMPDDAGKYLFELCRVMKPEGRIFCTAFLVDDRAKENIASGRSAINLRHRLSGKTFPFWTSNPECPEDAVGYDPEVLLSMFEQSGFSPVIHRGKWDGGEGLSGHDIIVARS